MLNTLNFLTSPLDNNMILTGNHNLLLVMLSIFIAIFSSYTALYVCEQVKLIKNRRWQFNWIGLGALALGTGIWSMHFIGMIAFKIPCEINYEPVQTLLSILPSIIASAIALYLCSRPSLSALQLIVGGVFVGSGIGAMHYSGMMAMRMNAQVFYDPVLFFLSIIVAVGLAILALWIRFGLTQIGKVYNWINMLSAIVMGMAMAGMHYTAMAAATFVKSTSAIEHHASGVDIKLTIVMTATVTSLVSMLVIVASFAHRYYVISKELEKSKQLIDNERLFLENVLEAVSDPIFVKNRQHHFVMLNNACCTLLGCAREKLLGKTDQLLFSAADAEKYYQIDEQVFVTGQPYINEENYPLEDGSIRHIEIKITPYFSSINEPLIVGVVRDITREKQILAELEKAKLSAEETAQIKAMFLANMSHEIRTPMNAIIGLSSLALNKQLTPEIRDYLQKIKSSSDSLLNILNDILDYSKVEAGHIELDLHLFDLDEMVQNLQNLFALRAGEKELALVIEVSSFVPKLLIGDSLRLQQILTNLLSNAIKFTSIGRVALTINRLLLDESQVKLQFRVEDTGIGMSDNDRNKLFKAFTQVDNSITRRFGGTGLGLVISGNLLKLMNGEFRIESELGCGTAFNFELQLALPALSERQAFEEGRKQRLSLQQTQQSFEQNKPLEQINILVAEDNFLNQQVVREFLELSGAKVEIAENGEQTLAWLERTTFDVILMDVHMPVMGGEEATQKIRAQEKFATLPIIALSAGVTRDERKKCLAIGMNDFVSKPIVPEELVTALLHWVKPRPRQTTPKNVLPVKSNDELDVPGFDLSNLLKMMNNNHKVVKKLLLKFKEGQADTLTILDKQLADGDYQQARFTVHTIKGVCGNLGAMALFEIAGKLENECDAKAVEESTLQVFRLEFTYIMASLEAFSASCITKSP